LMLTNVEPVNTYSAISSITEIAAGGGYTAGGLTITVTSSTQTGGVYKLILADQVLTATGTIAEWQYAVLYNDTAASKPPILWYTYANPVNMVNTNTFLFDFDGANGALNFQFAA